MKSLDSILRELPFFAGLDEEHARLVGGCARNCRFEPGQYLFHEGDPADEFFLIREGKVALDVVVPGQEPVVFSTLGEDEVVGASWLVPPYHWKFDARATSLTRALGIDAACLRRKCEEDHDFGYLMMKRFLPVFVKRLHATRLQMFDVYRKR
jgi:CRP-like cAMP-binding protein